MIKWPQINVSIYIYILVCLKSIKSTCFQGFFIAERYSNWPQINVMTCLANVIIVGMNNIPICICQFAIVIIMLMAFTNWLIVDMNTIYLQLIDDKCNTLKGGNSYPGLAGRIRDLSQISKNLLIRFIHIQISKIQMGISL